MDRVLRYDQLEDNLREVTDAVGMSPLQLPRANVTDRKERRPYQEWYTTTDTRDRVAEVFRREIDYFGWKFD